MLLASLLPRQRFFSYLTIRASPCVEQPPHFVKPHVTPSSGCCPHISECTIESMQRTSQSLIVCRFRLQAPTLRSQRESVGDGEERLKMLPSPCVTMLREVDVFWMSLDLQLTVCCYIAQISIEYCGYAMCGNITWPFFFLRCLYGHCE